MTARSHTKARRKQRRRLKALDRRKRLETEARHSNRKDNR